MKLKASLLLRPLSEIAITIKSVSKICFISKSDIPVSYN